MKNAYVTALCTGDAYVPGVEALGKSLVATGTRADRVAMVTTDVSESACARLRAGGWRVRLVDSIANPSAKGAELFPRFHDTFIKLHAWELVEYDHVVFLDADTIVLHNVDDLFDRPSFAAAPDFLLPDRFNSGVIALAPSQAVFDAMIRKLATSTSYDGGDQGFLNEFFGWYALPAAHRLPTGYNLPQFIYQFLHAHPSTGATLEREAKIIHYIVQKPWLTSATLVGGSALWWRAYLGARPRERGGWKTRLHAAQDGAFERLVRLAVR